MSATNNEYKTLVDEALHNHFHDTTETEMILKDWLYGVCKKAEAFDEIRADSKMDIYDFELGEYVLKTIKDYESVVE